MNASHPAAPLLDRAKLVADFPLARRYLVGVSGGRDSVALLHSLLEAGYNNLVACHLDHQLRGRSSRADARFVAALADKAGLLCEIGGADVRALARQSKVSIETAARAARFAFFVSVARKTRCRTIFLAHHADDLVETALLNLFRGASPAGMAAMRRISMHRIGKTELTLARPVLHAWRHEIDAFVKQRRLRFREDASNAQLNATRNRMRHRILPYIEKHFGRDVRRSIWRTAQIWTAEDELLESIMGQTDFNAPEVEVKLLRGMPVALQRRAIVRWLRSQLITDVGFEVVETVRALIEPQARSATANLPENRHARRRAGTIALSSRAKPRDAQG